jgi:Galactose oxidase, central domain
MRLQLVAPALLAMVVVMCMQGVRADTVAWARANVSTSVPSSRVGASAVTASDGSLVIFGGCTSSCCYAPEADVWALRGNAWTNVTVPGAAVAGRVYHAAVTLPSNTMLVFGGIDIEQSAINTTLLLNLSFAQPWQTVDARGGIPPRAGHSANVWMDGSVVVFGGRNDATVLSDLWLLDVATFTWTLLDAGTSSQGPGELVNHAAAVVPSWNGLFIAGGTDGDGADTGGLFLWTEGGGWASLGAALSPVRHGAVAWPYGTSAALVWGGEVGVSEDGVYMGDLWQIQLTQGGASGGQPRAVAVVLQNTTYSTDVPRPRTLASYPSAPLRLFGGFAGYSGGLDDRLFNDTWTLVSV